MGAWRLRGTTFGWEEHDRRDDDGRASLGESRQHVIYTLLGPLNGYRHGGRTNDDTRYPHSDWTRGGASEAVSTCCQARLEPCRVDQGPWQDAARAPAAAGMSLVEWCEGWRSGRVKACVLKRPSR
jgi:hypothetical protein